MPDPTRDRRGDRPFGVLAGHGRGWLDAESAVLSRSAPRPAEDVSGFGEFVSAGVLGLRARGCPSGPSGRVGLWRWWCEGRMVAVGGSRLPQLLTMLSVDDE